ncbi:hypothetical protein GIB67_015257 [Kingdonia uniflora]|uniref:pyruvate kinase n=1 Tax=Kingdonia uniflora TaxID=39325 RepID=A0A7J7MSP8_9MAGN|nr:hypothetical protein GIB67_015257 [Kingdonia uniflora]
MALVHDSLFLSRQISSNLCSQSQLFGSSIRLRKVSRSFTLSACKTGAQASLTEVSLPPKEGLLGFDVVTEGELKKKGFLGLRKTKLVCTIGPACNSLDALERLGLRGMNVARLNMCHNTREWHRDVIRNVKRLNEEKGFCISVMIDTEGIQMHMVDHGGASSIKAEDGSNWLFTTQKFEGSRPLTLQANYEGFSEGIIVGDEIVIDGGMASFEVIEKIGNDLHCKCTDSGLLLPRAKLSFWRNGKLASKNFNLPTLSTKSKVRSLILFIYFYTTRWRRLCENRSKDVFDEAEEDGVTGFDVVKSPKNGNPYLVLPQIAEIAGREEAAKKTTMWNNRTDDSMMGSFREGFSIISAPENSGESNGLPLVRRQFVGKDKGKGDVRSTRSGTRDSMPAGMCQGMPLGGCL